MKVGQLVEFVDHDIGAGFAPSPIGIGLIIALYNHCSPPEVEILNSASGEIMFQYGDELTVIQ